MVKETSLASVFFVGELMTSYKTVQAATFLALQPLAIVGAIYFLMNVVLSRLVKAGGTEADGLWLRRFCVTEGLCKRFGSMEVLRGVSISVFRQEIVSVIGPSGSGKSTFLRCLNWLERPTSGKVFFHQQEIPGKRLEICRYRQKIGMIFQNFNVFPNMTVLENITLAPILEKKVPKDGRS